MTLLLDAKDEEIRNPSGSIQYGTTDGNALDRDGPGKTLSEFAYNCMHMSKSIRLSDEAYERLAAHKREDETFSEVVLRLAGERSLLELAGILSDEEAETLRDAVDDRRERRSGELEEVADSMRDA